MYFCPNCSYTFDITKSSASNVDYNDLKTITTMNELIAKVEAGDDLSIYKADFLKKDLIKNRKYQKLSDINKLHIDQMYDKNLSSGAEFKCTNCNNLQPIKETILLYKITMDDNKTNKLENKVQTFDDNKFICKDPLLPHTKDYNCKNPSCITHKNENIKDSVFYRDKNTFKLNYICTVCYFGW